jgi:hypothetical protein
VIAFQDFLKNQFNFAHSMAAWGCLCGEALVAATCKPMRLKGRISEQIR